MLERLLVDGFAGLLVAGVARLERVAQDGMRVRASAGAASFRRRSTLQQCHDAAAERVRQLRDELEEDHGGLTRRQAAARQRAAVDRERRVAAALEAASELEAARATRDGRGGGGRRGAGRDGGDRRGPDRPGDDAGAVPASAEAPAPAEAPADAAAEAAAAPDARQPRASTTDAEARVMKMAAKSLERAAIGRPPTSSSPPTPKAA